MFTRLHDMLISNEWFGVSEDIEILKGLMQKPKSFKDKLRTYRRIRNFKTK